MKHKFFAFFIACAFVLNASSAAFAGTKSAKTTNPLLALLPASDVVVSLDAKRFFGVALPQILAGNKEMLDEVNAKIDDFKAKTSIDIRQFEQVAVGLASKPISTGKVAYEPIILARGNFSVGALVTLAKFASSGTYKEEKIGSRTVYVFSAKELIEKNRPTTKSSGVQKVLDMILPRLSGDVAVTAYDGNTLAFGRPERVRLMLTNSKSRVDANLLTLANRSPNAVASFAANLPKGLTGIFDLEEDELGQNLAAIRQAYGMLDLVGDSVNVSLAAKTAQNAQAEGLYKSLTELRELGKMFLGGSKSEDKKVYLRMLENVKIMQKSNEIAFDLQVPQSDINVLIGAK
jgi:hypothetical protein